MTEDRGPDALHEQRAGRITNEGRASKMTRENNHMPAGVESEGVARELSAATDVLLDLARLDAERRAVERLEPPDGFVSIRLSHWASKPLTPPHVAAIERTVEHPRREAIRMQIKLVGWRLFAAGDLDAMRAAYERLEIEAAVTDRFLTMVEHAWDGIGIEQRVWVA
jgi:hypothetical protein